MQKVYTKRWSEVINRGVLSNLGLLLILLVYTSDDTYLFGTRAGVPWLASFKLFLYVSISTFLILLTKAHNVNRLLLLLAFITLIFFSILFNSDLRGGYIYQLSIIVLAYALSNKSNVILFFAVYRRVIYYFGLISLLILSISIIFPEAVKLFPITINTSGIQAYNFYLSVMYFSDTFVRNTSIFREPGVYMVYLNFALMSELFLSKQVSRKRLAIFILCLITAASTAGIIVGIVIIIAALSSKDSSLNKSLRSFLFLSLLLSFLFFVFNIGYIDVVFDKFSATSYKSMSFIARISSVQIPLVIFWNNPLFGVGISTFDSLYSDYTFKFLGKSFNASGIATNSITNVFATYGMITGVLVCIGLLKFAESLSSDRFTGMLLSFAILGMFSNEDMRYSWFFFVIIFYGYKKFIEIRN